MNMPMVRVIEGVAIRLHSSTCLRREIAHVIMAVERNAITVKG
jgi:hypothetical protein